MSEMNPRVVDNDAGEITVELAGRELRGWSYANDSERRAKMLAGREYVEGWSDARRSADSEQPVAQYIGTLKDALRAARDELIKHDSEYHHFTDPFVKRLVFDAILSEPALTEPQTAPTRNEIIEECAKVCEGLRHADYSAESSDWSSGTFDCAAAIRALKTAYSQAVCAPQIVGTGVPPSLPLGWNDQHAAKAAWMINTLAISPPDEWLSKAELYETLGEFRALTRPLRADEPAISSHQRSQEG